MPTQKHKTTRFISALANRVAWQLPMPKAVKKSFSGVYFTTVKLPLILAAIVFGFVFELVMELPFIMLILLGYRSEKSAPNSRRSFTAPS